LKFIVVSYTIVCFEFYTDVGGGLHLLVG